MILTLFFFAFRRQPFPIMRITFAVALIFYTFVFPAFIASAQNLSTGKTTVCSAKKTVMLDAGAKREAIVKAALALLGTPYKYGGSSLNGFDCCGFVMYVYSQNGIHLPRTARDQFAAGRKTDFKKIKKGDLLFYSVNSKEISHVGIYIGGGLFIHSPVPGEKVRIERVNGEYWTKHFAGADTFIN